MAREPTAVGLARGHSGFATPLAGGEARWHNAADAGPAVARGGPMRTFKDELLAWAAALPDDATLEDVADFVAVRRGVEAGLRDAEGGRTISHEDVKRRVDAWLTSSGPAV